MDDEPKAKTNDIVARSESGSGDGYHSDSVASHFDLDDDFGDFGGFEAAEPLELDGVSGGLVASPSPWAVLPPAHQPPEAASTADLPVDQSSNVDSSRDLDVDSIDIGLYDDPLVDTDDAGLLVFKPDGDAVSIKSLLISGDEDNEVPVLSEPTYDTRPAIEAFPAADLTATVRQIDTTQALKSLQSNQKELESLLVDLKQQLAVEKSRYRNLQQEHTNALDVGLKSDHSLLKHAVGECREQMRTALVDQQQMFQDRMLQFAEKSQDLFAAALIAQREEFRIEQRNLLEDFQKAIEQIKNNFLVQVQQTIADERQQTKQLLQTALQDQRRELFSAIGTILHEEREASREAMAGHVTVLGQTMARERDENKNELLTLVEEERLRSKNAIGELVKVGRELSLKSADDASKRFTDVLDTYLRETKEAEAMTRKRQLEAVNLTLQSAARQMQELMVATPSGPDFTPHNDYSCGADTTGS